MVSMRAFCYLLIFLMLQLHAKVSNADFIHSQAPQAASSGGLEARAGITTNIANKVVVIGNRKVLKHVNANEEANEKNGLEIESKETVRKTQNKKRLTKTMSLTADYSDPGHHPPRHN